MRLTIYFDGQFWQGLIELSSGDNLYAQSHTFGKEPKDGEVFNFVEHELGKYLDCNNSQINTQDKAVKTYNPKRLQKLAHKQMTTHPVSTKAQQAMRLQQESVKKERESLTKEKRELIKEQKRFIKTEKKKQKHKGR